MNAFSPEELPALVKNLSLERTNLHPGTWRGYRSWHFSHKAWKGELWSHEIVLVEPKTRKVDGFILEATGWDANWKDIRLAQKWADLAGMPVALLFQVPNQPIDNLIEDALLAQGFLQYLQGNDPDDLVLQGMLNSVLIAADILQSELKLVNWVVTGASKRGWISWWAAIAQPDGLIACIPRVFDSLNMKKLTPHQVELWGEYSPKIADYSESGLAQIADKPEGAELLKQIDPFFWLNKVAIPTLSISGANDPFWALDSWSLIESEMPDSWRLLMCPNAGHGLSDWRYWIPTAAWFATRCAKNLAVDVSVEHSRTWGAHSPHWDFTNALWRPLSDGVVPRLERPTSGVNAQFVESWSLLENGKLRFSTPPKFSHQPQRP